MNGILRCKVGLCNSSLPETAKFPVWLPCDHHITRLIIRDCRHSVMHNGVRETLTELRSRFWLTKGRQVIRNRLTTAYCVENMKKGHTRLSDHQICLNSD